MIHPAPKPRRKRKRKPTFSSIVDRRTFAQKIAAAKKLNGNRKPIAKQGKKHAKRVVRNREYYASAEWRAKRKLVFARDGFQCVEMIPYTMLPSAYNLPSSLRLRCENFGMNINGKQTARGLVCEEKSYGHRGKPDYIDTCVTRCKECDRRLTPLERANHAQGFRR